MSLNSIIADAIVENEVSGAINRQAALNTAVPRILNDADLTEMCVRGHASKLITSQSKRRVKALSEASPSQFSFFGLNDRYVIGDDDGNIKRSEALTRLDFRSIILVRQKQVNADIAHLKKLQKAEEETRSIWDAHPNWTWGQVETEYARVQSRVAA